MDFTLRNNNKENSPENRKQKTENRKQKTQTKRKGNIKEKFQDDLQQF